MTYYTRETELHATSYALMNMGICCRKLMTGKNGIEKSTATVTSRSRSGDGAPVALVSGDGRGEGGRRRPPPPRPTPPLRPPPPSPAGPSPPPARAGELERPRLEPPPIRSGQREGLTRTPLFFPKSVISISKCLCSRCRNFVHVAPIRAYNMSNCSSRDALHFVQLHHVH